MPETCHLTRLTTSYLPNVTPTVCPYPKTSVAKNAGADDAAAAGAAAAARELTGHVTFTTGSDGRLVVTKESGSDGSDNRLGKLATEGRGVWEDVRADAKVQKLLKEEIAPGFENLIRASVEVVCDLMSALELPRVDGIYDSPLGSVCYHVDDLKFSEFRVAPNGLRVQNRTGENGERAGFGSTVYVLRVSQIATLWRPDDYFDCLLIPIPHTHGPKD